jgi:peroxiredoxin
MGPKTPGEGNRDSISPVDADKIIKSKAADFTLKDINGRAVSLSSLRGKVVLLNFWATWCPPCKAEMPSMNRLYNELRPRGFEILGISTDSSLLYVRDFLSKNRIDFQILFDEGKTVSRQYRVFSMPTTFLIDRNGIIVDKFYGEYDWTDPEVRQKVEKLL